MAHRCGGNTIDGTLMWLPSPAWRTAVVAIPGLALALGQGAASTGTPLDDLLLAVRVEYERVQAILAARSRDTEN